MIHERHNSRLVNYAGPGTYALEDKNSQLANLYFVGPLADFDTTNTGSGVYSLEQLQWPGLYLVCGQAADPGACPHNRLYDHTTSVWIVPAARQGLMLPLQDGYQGVSFAHVLWYWCYSYSVNPRVMLTHLQVEQTLVKGARAESVSYVLSHIPVMMSYGLDPINHSTEWPSVQIAGGVVTARRWFDRAPPEIPDSPHPDPSRVTPDTKVFAYSYRASDCRAGDKNVRFTLSNGVDAPAVFFSHTRSAWALFKYTNQINPCGCGGGNYLFMQTWAGYGFDQ